MVRVRVEERGVGVAHVLAGVPDDGAAVVLQPLVAKRIPQLREPLAECVEGRTAGPRSQVTLGVPPCETCKHVGTPSRIRYPSHSRLRDKNPHSLQDLHHNPLRAGRQYPHQIHRLKGWIADG